MQKLHLAIIPLATSQKPNDFQHLYSYLASLLFEFIDIRPDEKDVIQLIKEAIDVENRSMGDMLPPVDRPLFQQLLYFVSNRLLLAFRYKQVSFENDLFW